MIYKRILCNLLLSLVILGSSCSKDIDLYFIGSSNDKPIELSGTIKQQNVSRADEGGFGDGDCMGIYIVDYENGKSAPMKDYDNRATNLAYTYDESEYKWKSATKTYWKDDKTCIDVYGYYPFDNGVNSVSEYLFTIESDQSRGASAKELGGYEKSDFLWAKCCAISPTNDVITLEYHHKMAGVKVNLIQGDGFESNEWDALKRDVTIDNTICQANIDLSTGVVVPATKRSDNIKQIIAAPQGNDVYRCVIIPQLITGDVKCIGVNIDGVSCRYQHNAPIAFESGKMHTFTLSVNRQSGGTYNVALISQDIEAWENDKSSHKFEASAYTVIECPQEGTLEQCIIQTGKNICDILNLKIIGCMNDDDFQFLRQLTNLQRLNLYDVTPLALRENNEYYTYGEQGPPPQYYTEFMESITKGEYYENMLTHGAFGSTWEKSTIKHLVLPKNLKVIGESAIHNIELAENSTLTIPNSVKIISHCGIYECGGGTLELPDSLIFIGSSAFSESSFNINLKLGNSIKRIGRNAFYRCQRIKGTFNVPEKLEYLGDGAFENAGSSSLTGTISLPQTITTIPNKAFYDMGFTSGMTLAMHDGIYKIGESAFASNGWCGHYTTINNRLIWPKNLRFIEKEAFLCVRFSGGIDNLPSTLVSIGIGAFNGARNMPRKLIVPSSIEIIEDETFANTDIESVELPTDLTYIGANAFNNCTSLKEVFLGKNIEEIGNGSFGRCIALRSIRCLATTPPSLGDGVFEQCNFDQLILEVPEKSLNIYRTAKGWCDFKYITAYHELATNISEIKCLDKGQSRDMVVRSEGTWIVSECPAWVSISPTSSENRITETKVTVSASSTTRNGRIGLKLKDTGYTTYVDVNQYIASEPEDKEIILQEASAGGTSIPIFVIGDGFTADKVADGTYLRSVMQNVEHFFSIEPFKSYRNYFSVSTALVSSSESGINSVLDRVVNRFETTDDPVSGYRCNYDELRDYALSVSNLLTINNIDNALIILIANQDTFNGNIRIEDSGLTYTIVANSSDDLYPYDQRGLVQHYAGGRAFGRLGVEYVTHFDFINACTCGYCNKIYEFKTGIAKGWYKNLTLSNDIYSLPWRHLMFDPRYSNYVDIYEGGWWHTRGVWRSEPQSCMDTFIPYYSAWCRELIVRRIMDLAGKPYDFEDFVSHDSWEGHP